MNNKIGLISARKMLDEQFGDEEENTEDRPEIEAREQVEDDAQVEEPAAETGDEHQETERPQPKHISAEQYEKERQQWQQQLHDWQRREQQYRTLLEPYLKEQQEKQEREKPKVPAYEEDPTANLDHRAKQLDENYQKMQWQFYQLQDAQQHERDVKEFTDYIADLEGQFVKERSDYPKALEYMRNLKMKELSVFGKRNGLSENQLRQQLGRLELNAALQAVAAGVNPAQMVYDIATAYGYQPSTESKDEAERKIKGARSAKSAPGAQPERMAARESDDYDAVGAYNDALAELFPNMARGKR